MDDAIRATPRGRRPHFTPDPEMVEGGSDGRRPMGGDENGYTARGGDFAAAGECVSTLRLRPLGGGMAAESGARTSCSGPLRGRSGNGVSAPDGCRAIPERVSGAAGEVWTGTSPGKD